MGKASGTQKINSQDGLTHLYLVEVSEAKAGRLIKKNKLIIHKCYTSLSRAIKTLEILLKIG